MTYYGYRYIFGISALVCIILTIISIILFIKFNILSVIGYMSGITQKRALLRLKKNYTQNNIRLPPKSKENDETVCVTEETTLISNSKKTGV